MYIERDKAMADKISCENCDRLQQENHLLQQLWVTVNLSCTPPDGCNDPEILKRYMAACLKKADEYEAFIDGRKSSK